MATQLIATGVGAAASAEFVLAVGEVATVCLKDAALSAKVNVQLKNDVGGWVRVGELLFASPAGSISSPGTYRLNRVSGRCGVFRA